MPHFKVLTTGSESVARSWAGELERFRLMLGQVVNVPEEMVRPLTVVMFSSDRAMRPFKPLEKGKPQKVSGLFVNVCDSHAIELSLDGDQDEIRRIIFHEAVHWYSNASEVALPPWLEEGVAEVYSTFRLEPDGTCSFGKPVQDHLEFLPEIKQWSMEKLVMVTPGSLAYNESDRASEFYARAWLAVHYLIFGEDSPGRASVARYLQVRSREHGFDRAFQEAFGMGYRDFDGRLADYLKHGRYHIEHRRPPATESDRLIRVRPASDGEVELALGTLLMGARREGNPEVEARLRKAADLMPSDPAVWQALGENAIMANREEEAESYFNRAVACGSSSYYAHYGLALSWVRGLEQQGFLADTGQTHKALRELQQAIRLNPRFVPAYEAMAGLISADQDYDSANRALLQRGARLAPDSLVIEVGLASCELKSGQREVGRRRLELVLQDDRRLTPQIRHLAEGILLIDDWDRFNLELDQLFQAGKYREALVRLEKEKGHFSSPEFSAIMRVSRRRAEGFAIINEAVESANSGREGEAIARLRRLVADADDNTVRQEAGRLLHDLEVAIGNQRGR